MIKYKGWENIIPKIKNFEFRKGITTFVNPYSMYLLKDDDFIKDIDFIHVDGFSLVKKLNSTFFSGLDRFSFDNTSLAPVVFGKVKREMLSLAIVGTTEESIHKAVENIQEIFGVSVKYFRNGYFKDDEEKIKCIDEIINLKIDVVIAGMGTPSQELFLIQLKRHKWNGYGYTCGGYLHQIAKKSNYYPDYIDRLNLRWLYRLYDEPKLMKRYFILYPKFFLLFKRYTSGYANIVKTNLPK
jgi:exopolysaccharide biosynthesis WecB/TagA/CpsF family protein